MIATATDPRPQAKPRLWFLDNLKVVLTILVILHHTGQAYGPTGGFWYFQNPERWSFLGLFFWVNASFFMGLFFLISGYFFPGSYDRHGAGKFLKDRLIRFGIPTLVFVALINPIMMYFSFIHFRGGSMPLLSYITDIYFGLGNQPAGWTGHWPDINFGHLWFAEHLLAYAALYTVFRLMSGKRTVSPAPERAAPSDIALLGYALGLVAVTYVTRIWFPIDRWIGFLGFIQMEPAHLPQYASLFLLGIMAYRHNWAVTMPAARGRRWLYIGIAAVLAAAAGRFGLLGEALKLSQATASTIYIIPETFIAVGLSVGLITLFRERWNRTGALPSALSGDAYAAYLIHFPVVVACQYAVDLIPAGALVRFLLAGTAAVVLSFASAHLLRKIPGATRVL